MTETSNKKWILWCFLFLGLVFALDLSMLQIFDDEYKRYANSNALAGAALVLIAQGLERRQ